MTVSSYQRSLPQLRATRARSHLTFMSAAHSYLQDGDNEPDELIVEMEASLRNPWEELELLDINGQQFNLPACARRFEDLLHRNHDLRSRLASALQLFDTDIEQLCLDIIDAVEEIRFSETAMAA